MTTTTAAHLFPSPLSSDPDDPDFPSSVDDGARDVSVTRIHGRCAPFCATEGPTAGASVADHDAKCLSAVGASVSPVLESGRLAHLVAFLARPYLHGTYSSVDAAAVEQSGFVELSADIPTADGWVEKNFYLSAADARTLGAGLTRMANVLEWQDELLRTERERRENRDHSGEEVQA
ncbi:hypothetical protein EV645_3979 [Kribbella rubisoli]|uniref:Uncharacterized protein n=1 Tax=Kribbella rubisoli TaxID=3075929 RepID=A0A4Q7X0L7_9ACTN|nr:hypothetical protein [Kribbella rubisoli]RZU16414.1 hypothetical protein EV645_3979 [Kribbella rubisoli]